MRHNAPFDDTLFDPASNTHMLQSLTIVPGPTDERPLKFVVTGRDEHRLGKLTRLLTAEWLADANVQSNDSGVEKQCAPVDDGSCIVEAVRVSDSCYEFEYSQSDV
mmetsp:Transcript_70549/g.133077  ORF Transcript_70549/g.133077 Transcript_70549/m.133077 type:complete len:106 (+) Transcript_70549:180-497(+)